MLTNYRGVSIISACVVVTDDTRMSASPSVYSFLEHIIDRNCTNRQCFWPCSGHFAYPAHGTVNLIRREGLRLADTKYYGTIRDCLEGLGIRM